MDNQIERIYKKFVNKPFTTRQLHDIIHENWTDPLIIELSNKADNGWFQMNYLASLLNNQVRKAKKPKWSRIKNKNKVFEYTYLKQ